MTFESHSQAGQDRFVLELLGHSPGKALDIGANHPTQKSNTYALEQMGWRGLLVENDENCAGLLARGRSWAVITEDATKLDWAAALSAWGDFDYLSLDVDAATLRVLQRLPLATTRFRVITLEHDSYRFGPAPRALMLSILSNYGYEVLCADVCDQGMPFEIWAIDPVNVDLERAMRFRSARPTDWTEFFHNP